jgi:hypothetical protein
MSLSAFSPLGNTLTVTTTAASSTTAQSIPGSGGDSAMVYNPNNEVKFIKFGDANVAAASPTDIVVPANGYMPFGIPPGVTHCTVYGATASQSVYVMRGSGQ